MDEQTQTAPPPDGNPAGGPRVTGPQARDLTRLRRSRGDRYIGGVAGGLGRHLDVDPTVVRVLLVVLALFGGAGLLLYAALWAFVPSDDRDSAPVNLGEDTQKIVVLVLAAIAGLVFLGAAFGDSGWRFMGGFPVPLILVALVVITVFATRDRRSTPTVPPAPWGAAGTTSPRPPTPGDPMTTTAPVGPPPAWAPPVAPPVAPPPPRPRRTGLVLFWPTLALVAIALGTLGVVDASTAVTPAAYPALALTVVGLMLLLGAFVGRPGGLIALGLVALMTLGAVGTATSLTGGATRSEERVVRPLTAAAVPDSYSLRAGELVFDLTSVQDLEALDGRDLRLSVYAGQVTVLLPRGLAAEVDASFRFAGAIDVDGTRAEGPDPSMSKTVTSTAGPDAPSIDLTIVGRVGEIDVQVR